MLSNDQPAVMNSVDDQAWDAYDATTDHDLRRARWLAIAAGWILGQDEMLTKLLSPLSLAELIDLDASLTGLRYELRQVIAKMDEPRTKMALPELGQD